MFYKLPITNSLRQTESAFFSLNDLQIEVDEDDISDGFESLFGKLSGKVCYSYIHLNNNSINIINSIIW